MNWRVTGLIIGALLFGGVVLQLWAGEAGSLRRPAEAAPPTVKLAGSSSAKGRAGEAGGAAAGTLSGSMRFRGVAIQINTSYQAVETYSELVHEIADLGANTVMLCCTGTMEHAKSQGIYIDHRKTPAPAQMHEIMAEARARGLAVIIMPIVLLSHPRGSEWRGVIEPPNWEDWWKQYRQFIEFFADVAREGGADALMIGSELVSTEKYTSQWVKVIEAARARFKGRLGYSANWDHYKPIQFWDKLDFIGMTTYNTLADKKLPSVDEVAAKWKPVYDEVMNWRKTIEKPILLTEVGWCSQEGAASAPWNYYQNQKATTGGHEEQRRLYEAFLRVWGESSGLNGMIWWEWTPGDGGKDDFGYTPKGKPAEALLRSWFARFNAATEATR